MKELEKNLSMNYLSLTKHRCAEFNNTFASNIR